LGVERTASRLPDSQPFKDSLATSRIAVMLRAMGAPRNSVSRSVVLVFTLFGCGREAAETVESTADPDGTADSAGGSPTEDAGPPSAQVPGDGANAGGGGTGGAAPQTTGAAGAAASVSPVPAASGGIGGGESGTVDAGVAAAGAPTENSGGQLTADAGDGELTPVEVPMDPKPPPLWNENSIRVRVESVNFFNDMLFEQDVAWLSPEQIAALGALDFEWNEVDPNAVPSSDGGPTTVTVTDIDGTVRVGVTPRDGWELSGPELGGFLSTFTCRLGGNYLLPLEDEPEAAPRAAPNDGCYHAFRDAGWFVVDVATPGEVRFALTGNCGAGAQVSVYPPGFSPSTTTDAGGAPLGEEVSEDATCPELSVEISEAGAFPVYVSPASDGSSEPGEQNYFRVSTPLPGDAG
jgi:hypothetical protein